MSKFAWMILLSAVVSNVECRPAELSPRIIGGFDVQDGRFPWTISVEYYGSFGWLHMCGGALIKPYYALTGAKCVSTLNPALLRAWAGLLYLNDTEATNAQLLEVVGVHVHEEYDNNAKGVPNDLAILQFSTPTDTSRYNVELALLPENDGNSFNHDGCFIYGWGVYDDQDKLSMMMQYTRIPVIANEECVKLVETVVYAEVLHTHICAYADPPVRGACNGDSGSPLSCYPGPNDPSVEYVVGIASWTIVTEGQCNTFYPSVYTRLSKYLDWIEENTPDP